MATIHIVVQSKSVGKTIVASLLTQCLRDECGKSVLCLDTDEICFSLSNYQALQAVQVPVKGLPAYCRTLPQDSAHVVIDTSTASFMPFCSLLQSVLLQQLEDAGHIVRMHTVVAGGPEALPTFSGFRSLASNFPTVPLTVWLNPFYGSVALQDKSFEESRVYQEHSASVHALVRLPENSQLTQEDFQDMLARHLTFKEVLHEGCVSSIGPKSRLKRLWQDTIEQVNCAALCG